MRGLLLLLLACLAASTARAEFPDRPLRLIVGYAPGGTTDIVARVVAEAMGPRLGQPILVENRGGAGGAPAAMMVVQAAPDGHTLMLHTLGPNQAAALGTPLPYDPLASFAPIGMAALGANALVVHPSVPARTMGELRDLALRSPTPLRFGTPSLGLTTALFAQGMGIEFEEVRYRGTSAALNDLLAGRVDAYTIALGGILSHVQSGALRALAIAGRTRSQVMPDLPTTVEAGFPDVIFSSWFGLATTAGTPPDRVRRLHAVLNEVLSQPEVLRRLLGVGLDVEPSPTPEDFGRFVAEDHALWQRVARRGNLRQ